MNYCSSIVVDFGSTNSGCARTELGNNQDSYLRPIFIQGSQTYAKDDTWFFVHPVFWERICRNYAQIQDSDFRIRSRALPYTRNPNVIWGRQHIKACADTIESEGWLGFKYFKMRIYHKQDFIVNGQTIPVRDIVRLFLRILRIECLDFESGRQNRAVSTEEIQWGITIPTIWGDRERKLMTEIASEVFGDHIRVLSEAEGPVLSGLMHAFGDGHFSLKKNRVSLVADVGGGTTDITLLKEVSEDVVCEYPLREIATTDGVGVGGNNIDEAYWNYLFRLLSEGKTSDDGCNYDSLSDEDLRKMLLTPFMQNLRSFIEMEDAWLNFKHGDISHIQFPPSYLKWLRGAGHSQIAEFLKNIMIGETEININELKQHVFQPTLQHIAQKIKKFLQTNTDKIPQNSDLFMVVKSGGLSLLSDFRNLIDEQVNDLGFKFTSASLGADALSVSGSVMDGAGIVLLNRKIINRKAPFNIFYDMGTDLNFLKRRYAEMGINMKLGELNEILDRDIQAGAHLGEYAIPVGIKGEYLKDHSTSFVPASNDQKTVAVRFYGKEDGFVVLPCDNPQCWLLGEISCDTQGSQHFKLTIDFNEYPNNNNFHYFITSANTGEVMSEGNILVKLNTL